MRFTLSTSVRPVLLGAGSLTLKTALCLFCRYSLRSFVFADERTLSLRLPIFSSFHTLRESTSDEFILMDLSKLPVEYGESTYLLIPCTERYTLFVSHNIKKLEGRFIIRTPRQIFEEKELFPLKAHHRKD